MYICLCNAISDKQVRAQACQGRCTVADVYRAAGCRPQCGKCIPALREALRELDAEAVEPGAFLEGAAASPSD